VEADSIKRKNSHSIHFYMSMTATNRDRESRSRSLRGSGLLVTFVPLLRRWKYIIVAPIALIYLFNLFNLFRQQQQNLDNIIRANKRGEGKLLMNFKKGDWVAYHYQTRNEHLLAQVVGVAHNKNAITLKYLKSYDMGKEGVEETVDYRPGLLQNHNKALLARTGTFANCTRNVENNTVIFGEDNGRSATVSCRTIRFAAEASSFVGKSGSTIVGVLSTSDNFSWRKTIRATWAANSTVFFVLAGSWNDIKEEYHEYKDIIWIDMQESFRLITYKTSMFFQVVNMMASELNLTYSHVLKTDDDSYVALGRLEQLVKSEDPKHLDYWGHTQSKYVKPIRDPENRYYESLDQYPEPYYPPYVTGSAILLSRKTVECVTKTMQEARFLDMEDVFIAIVAARCGYVPTHSNFVRVYRDSMHVNRWTTEHNTQEVTMKNTIVQHHILSPGDMIAHHESIKTDPFQFDAILQPSSASPSDGSQQELKEVETRAEREREATTPRLEFVHVTKTGGSAIEHAAAAVGITWGSCHYMKVEEVGCSSPDLPYEAPDYQSYALTSPWHTPPKLLKMYVEESKYPYNDADLFTVIRNPYSRVLSEYYCPWNGFQPKYRRGTVYEKDPNDPKVMNEWVKGMVKVLGTAMDEFNDRKEEDKFKKQAKGLNEDRHILAQKHYVNQAEYVYDGDEIVVKDVVHYENLSSEFDALMKKYNINVTLPPKEEGIYADAQKSRLSYKDLDPESIALINEFAKVDFEKFGYQMVEKKFGENYSLEANMSSAK
jgi:hypothetical protein